MGKLEQSVKFYEKRPIWRYDSFGNILKSCDFVVSANFSPSFQRFSLASALDPAVNNKRRGHGLIAQQQLITSHIFQCWLVAAFYTLWHKLHPPPLVIPACQTEPYPPPMCNVPPATQVLEILKPVVEIFPGLKCTQSFSFCLQKKCSWNMEIRQIFCVVLSLDVLKTNFKQYIHFI